MAQEKLTLSIEEAAAAIGIGRNLCYSRAKAGQIPTIRIGRRLLVPRRALDKLLEGGPVLGPNAGQVEVEKVQRKCT